MEVPNTFVGKRIGENRIELVALIGEGSYGCVYRGVLHQAGLDKPCAVKCLAKSNLDAYHLMCQRREILLHKQVSEGEGIVSLYETFEDSDYQWIVMENCSDGDLWEAIADGQYADKDDSIREVFTQVLDAVEYCHSKHVFHRDIKPENILLSDGGRKVLLADFGLASGSPVSNELRCGSPWYMSPECWGGIFNTDHPYATAPNDVWCLGILLINLACGRHAPWRHANRQDAIFRDFIQQPEILRLLLPLSSQVHDLLARVFVLNPSERISIRDFRSAISQIKHFGIPMENLRDFHDNRPAMWSSTMGPIAHPQPAEITRRVPVTALPLAPSVDEEGVDITDAYFKPVHNPIRRKAPGSFIRRIPVIDTSPQTLCGTSSASYNRSGSTFLTLSLSTSENSVSMGPVTPPMPATVLDVEVPDILGTSKGAIVAPSRPVSPFSKLSFSAVKSPFQNILRAIGAL